MLQSAQGSSLVMYASTLRLWCLLEQCDHGIRFTCTRTRVEKSKMKIWNWIWPVNGLCDLDYSFNLSVMLLSMRVAAIYCGYSSTFRPVIFFSTRAKREPFACRWGTWNLAATRFFFAHLAAWSSPCAHQRQQLVFPQLFGVFDVTRFIWRLRLSMNVVYFYCHQWCIAFHSHLIADTSASSPINR